jgi:hypothetical protein
MLLAQWREEAMSLRKLLTCAPLAALLVLPPIADAKERNGKKHKTKAKDAVEWRSRTERDRYKHEADPYPWPRETRGHRPHDNSGDGVVTRDEWPGNDNSFRKLDRNGDGKLSDEDRKLQRKDSRFHRK